MLPFYQRSSFDGRTETFKLFHLLHLNTKHAFNIFVRIILKIFKCVKGFALFFLKIGYEVRLLKLD
jgi:hypothetical protein